MNNRNLVDEDGENYAVRMFLSHYSSGSTSADQMKCHLENCGFHGLWPEWVNDPKNSGHLTKGGAQDWLRYLFALENTAITQAEITELAEKAGFYFETIEEYAPTQHTLAWQYSEHCFHRFAELLAKKLNDKPAISIKDEVK